ncbi:MAG: exodeoxyribonuclease V subunit gamma [Candidatus Brocadia sp.]|nr:exodeoxyribonuclease V subunit gamma [Candidatus Brocadia sp.]
MLTVKIGHYHPSLEDSFVETIEALKRDDPMAPLAVVAPTNWMLNRLQERLVQEQNASPCSKHTGASFMNISFMNFYVLAKEICRRSGIDVGRIIQQSVIYESIIAGLLKQHSPQEPLFKNVQSLPALARALFQVIQDIADANVHVDDLKAAVREGFVEGMEIQKLYGVIHLYDMFKEKLKSLNISHYSDVYRTAAACVPDSEFLRGFQHILAYGFYDLTGVEQDFFREIFRTCPTTLFLPYQKKHPAFAYVKPFFESFVLGLARDVEELSTVGNTGFSCLMDSKLKDTSVSDSESLVAGHELSTQLTTYNSQPATHNQKPVIINASGKHDEVWTVAKEILKLGDEGYGMEDIGIVARSLEPYTDAIKKIFQENCIPFITSAHEPLEKYPLIKVIKQILLLKRDDFYRPTVIELLGSPYFKIPLPAQNEVTPRPDLWDILSRRLGIRDDIGCWLSRLEQAKVVSPELSGLDNEKSISKGGANTDENTVPHSPSCEGGARGSKNMFPDGEETGRRIHIPSDQVELLENVLRALSNDLSSLPEKTSWTIMVQKITCFLRSYIHIPSEAMHPEDKERDLSILDKIWELLHTLCTLDCLGEEVTFEQFIDTFIDACRQESLPIGSENGWGVKVLDAMSARGIPFRALFILGLNEKVFPRAISEEPFLRDHVRRRLSEVLGNFIPEKLRGFDEERLLFNFLLNAAGERLYLLHERSDEAGKPKAQSHYLMDILQNLKGVSVAGENPGKKPEHEIYVPRGIKDKLCKQEISLLTPKEVGIRMALDRIDPTRFMNAFGINRAAFDRSQSALGFIESYNPRLTSYDGFVGDMSGWWNVQAYRGLSPTMLETFGTCPFKFFMSKIMELEPLEEPETAEMISAVDLGTLYHNLLRDFYLTLIEKEYFLTKTKKIDPIKLLKDITQKYFTETEQQIPIPYPIIWEIEKEEILALLTRFVTWDLEQIEKTGYIPTYLEKAIRLSPQNDLHKLIPVSLKQAGDSKIAFKGKIDRIDTKKEEDAVSFRVVDYKSGKSLKENIVRSAIRGQRLQLPFYIIMAEHLLSEAIKKGQALKGQARLDEASFVYVAENMDEKDGQISPQRKTIDRNDWMACREQYWETMREFLKIIREGIFPISPAEDPQRCEWCEFATTCRKGHQPLRFRLEQDARLKKYREIMNLNIRKKSGKS